MTDDFYDLLDVPSDASQDDIKRAYRNKVQVYHPDHNDDDRARAQFTALQKAYEILGDPVERKAYDRLGHEDYVAKRTKGLPSPDVWRSSSDDSGPSATSAATDEAAETSESDDASGTAESDDAWSTTRSTASRSGTASSTTASSTAGYAGSADPTGASDETGSTSGTASDGAGSRSTNPSADDRSSGVGSAHAGGVGTAAGTSSTGGSNGSPAGAASSAGYGSRSGGRSSRRTSRPGPLTDNVVVRWWRDRNFSVPLLWVAAITYLVGLARFVAANEAPVRSLGTELAAAGADATAIRELLTESRHGIDTVAGYMRGVELLAPPLPATQWYAALAGSVGLALLVVVAARIAWRRDTWGPVSIDETIVVSLALGVSTTLVGGPLLAGAVLVPLLFGVVVHRTHTLPGWSPSYAWLVGAVAPLGGLVADALGYASLAVDLVAFGVLPVVCAVGLPLRVLIRTRFGR